MATSETAPPLSPAQVARIFGVDPKTVTRWAATGKIKSIRTPGGHRRYSDAEIQSFLNGAADTPAAAQPDPEAALAEPISGRSEPRHTGPPVEHHITLAADPVDCSCGWHPTIEPGHSLRAITRLANMHTGEANA
jgi:excisionase family DNA binding protein